MFSAIAVKSPIVKSFIEAVGTALCELRTELVRDNIRAKATCEDGLLDLTFDFCEEDIGTIHLKMTAEHFPKTIRGPRYGMATGSIFVDGVELQNSEDQPGNLMHVLQQVQSLVEEIELQPQEKVAAKLDVAVLFSDMQANALRILDLTVQRNGPTPLARRLNVEEGELWTSLADGMYWYEEPASESIYYAILFVLPATHDVPAGNPENDRLAFFFKQYGRTLVLEEIRVNGNSIADGNGSFETWAKEHDTVVMSFYERSEELRAEVEDGDWRPEGKPVIVTIESDSARDAAIVTALLRHAMIMRDSRMHVGAREDLTKKGLHGMVINAPSETLPLLTEAYQSQENFALDQSLVDMRPLLLDIRVK